jgi:hypothetical protein
VLLSLFWIHIKQPTLVTKTAPHDRSHKKHKNEGIDAPKHFWVKRTTNVFMVVISGEKGDVATTVSLVVIPIQDFVVC